MRVSECVENVGGVRGKCQRNVVRVSEKHSASVIKIRCRV